MRGQCISYPLNIIALSRTRDPKGNQAGSERSVGKGSENWWQVLPNGKTIYGDAPEKISI